MNNQFGLLHFFNHADSIAIGLFILLTAMSLCTWTLAGQYLLFNYRNHQHYSILLKQLYQNKTKLEAHDFQKNSVFTWAYQQHTQLKLMDCNQSNSLDFLLDRCASRLDKGQIILASIAATAPFAGLLGTVWGIYHALMTVATSGQASIDKIMGPVGETLLMTALGLLVALPAVLIYNLINRSNSKCMLNIQFIIQHLNTNTLNQNTVLTPV